MVKPAFGVELKAPYYTKDKWVASLFFDEKIQSQITPPKRVYVHDVTLRDGEQGPRVVFTPEEKILIAKYLDRLGVNSIEPGLPATREDQEVIKELGKLKLKSKIVPLCRVKKEDVQACLDLRPDGVLLEIGINPFLLRDVFKRSPESLIDEVVEYVAEFKKAGMYVEFMGWDAFRVEIGYVERFFRNLCERCDLDRVTVADTFGMSHPLSMFYFMKEFKKWTNRPTGLHIHNDFGMATANAVMAISAGAETVHSSINGLGERTGNLATEEIGFALQHLFNIDAGIDLSQISAISEIVAEISKVPRARNKPVVGSALFEVEAGIVVHVIESMKAGELGGYAVFPFHPKTVGRDELVVIAGRGTGRHTIEVFLNERGLKADEAAVARITERIKQTGLILKNALPKSVLDQIITEEIGRDTAKEAAVTR